MFSDSQQALDFVHEYAKQVCLTLPQVEDVTIENDMELTVKAVEGHTFIVPLQPLQDKINNNPHDDFNDESLIYYLTKRINESLGYKDIWPVDLPNIYPVIKNTAFIHENDTAEENRPLFQPLAGDLWVCYAVFKEGRLHYINSEHVKFTFRIGNNELHTLALNNLHNAQAGNAKAGAIHHPVWQLAHEVKYADDAGVLLLPYLWDELKSEAGMQDIVVSIPHADCVLFCDANDDAAVAHLKETTHQIYEQADQPLSTCLFWWNPDIPKWQTSRVNRRSFLERARYPWVPV
ncbi:MAG: DUF1444 family protein [Gammaproteobacteria bacterium]|nr:DUF1444 family protein [Gammaproteobacteria bacterium]MDH5653106.1 DUF1444 family protein [Gammaproteobacteria bacterium]